MVPTIKTKSYRDSIDKIGDGIRLLIMRKPRGVKRDKFDIKMIELSPSIELLDAWNKGRITEDDFRTTFLGQMVNNKKERGIEKIWELHSKLSCEIITLLCKEPEGEFCHRHIVKELVENPQQLIDLL